MALRPGPWRRQVSQITSAARSSSTAAASRPHASSALSSRPKIASLSQYRIMGKSFTLTASRDRCGCAAAQDARRTAYIALGSNMGNRVAMIEQACKEMDSRGIKVKRTSGLWETEPMYVLDQDRFVNGACEVETQLEPLSLLDQLQDIEKAMGRRKLIDKGPRNIDLDVLMYENETVDHERLKIPHIGIPEREFVLRPLAQIAATKSIDATKPWKMIQDYLHELPPTAEPLSTLTPIGEGVQPLNALKSNRKTHVMAILNVTPDSFSDGGVNVPETLTETILRFIKGGATMIDIGGQSTAPGRPQVSVEEEIRRIVPAIELIRSLPQAKDIAISIDTYRASVAEAAVKAGADVVNDVSAGLMDAEMLPMMAKLEKTVCLMHMRGDPSTMSQLNDYPEGLIPTVAKELLARVAAAEAAGIRRWRIILDPGFGFAKVGEQNIDLLRHFEELRNWPGLEGLPWLLGSSRKSFIGKITGVAVPGDRIFGTAATVTAAVQVGADIVRVHDVVEMGQVVKMADAIWRY